MQPRESPEGRGSWDTASPTADFQWPRACRESSNWSFRLPLFRVASSGQHIRKPSLPPTAHRPTITGRSPRGRCRQACRWTPPPASSTAIRPPRPEAHSTSAYLSRQHGQYVRGARLVHRDRPGKFSDHHVRPLERRPGKHCAVRPHGHGFIRTRRYVCVEHALCLYGVSWGHGDHRRKRRLLP